MLQIGRAFLQPYDLNADASTFTAVNTSGPIHQALQSLSPTAVQVYAYRPYSHPGAAGSSTAGASNTTNSTSSTNSTNITSLSNSRWVGGQCCRSWVIIQAVAMWQLARGWACASCRACLQQCVRKIARIKWCMLMLPTSSTTQRRTHDDSCVWRVPPANPLPVQHLPPLPHHDGVHPAAGHPTRLLPIRGACVWDSYTLGTGQTLDCSCTAPAWAELLHCACGAHYCAGSSLQEVDQQKLLPQCATMA